MRDPITTEMVQRQVEWLDSNSQTLGLIEEGQFTEFTHGSKLNGIAFRIHLSSGYGGGLDRHPAIPNASGFLGMTKREAYDTLSAVNAALNSVIFNREKVIAKLTK